MSDEPEIPDEDDEPEPEPQSRRARARQEQVERDAEKDARIARLERENVMIQAGIDLQTPLGQIFANGYNGELTVEAVKELAMQAGIAGQPAPVETPEEPTPDPDDGSTDARRLAAGGAAPDGGQPSPDPRLEAVKAGEEALAQGGTGEAAMGAFFDRVASAGYNGDERAQWYAGKVDPRRPLESAW